MVINPEVTLPAAFSQVVSHETGHTFALKDCGGCTAGSSAMTNGAASVNDTTLGHDGPSACDSSKVQQAGQYGTGGGGPGDGGGDPEDDPDGGGCDPLDEYLCQLAGGVIWSGCECHIDPIESFMGKTREAYPVTMIEQSFLTLDLNKSGKIDGPSELVGKARLSTFDAPGLGGNADGKIDSKDGVFSLLLLWRDSNRNGISEQGEVRHLSGEIPLDYKGTRAIDVILRSK